jgi:hypothetical protein
MLSARIIAVKSTFHLLLLTKLDSKDTALSLAVNTNVDTAHVVFSVGAHALDGALTTGK